MLRNKNYQHNDCITPSERAWLFSFTLKNHPMAQMPQTEETTPDCQPQTRNIEVPLCFSNVANVEYNPKSLVFWHC